MAITRTQSKVSASVTNIAMGSFLDDAGTPEAMGITLGFVPRYVKVLNETDHLIVEKFEGQVAANTNKTAAAGDISLATDSAILLTANGFTFLKSLTVQNKQYRWMALG